MAKPIAATSAPAIPAPGGNYVELRFVDFGWDDVFLLPADAVSPLLDLLKQAAVLNRTYLQGGCLAAYPKGRPTVTMSTFVPEKVAVLRDCKEAAAFKAFHESTYELTPAEDRPNGTLIVSVEDFRNQPKGE